MLCINTISRNTCFPSFGSALVQNINSSGRDNFTKVTVNIAVEVATVKVNEDILYPSIQQDNQTERNESWIYDVGSTIFLPWISLSKYIVNPFINIALKYVIATVRDFLPKCPLTTVRSLFSADELQIVRGEVFSDYHIGI